MAVASSARYEVCPHNAEQCDNNTLDLNNNTWGEATTDQVSIDATMALEQMEENPPMFSSTWFNGLTSVLSSRTVDIQRVNEPSPFLYHIDNNVAAAGVIDDSYWRTIHINSEEGTVCSYRLLNQNETVNNNVYELKLSNY